MITKDHLKKLLGLFFIAIVVTCWIAMALILQRIQQAQTGSTYDKPFFLTYYVHAGYSFALPMWAVWHFSTNSAPFVQEITPRLLLACLALSQLANVVGFTWYKSLSLTVLSTNTAIYNSSPTVVFLLSIFFLNEPVTIYKALSVLVCIGGVVVVALFSPTDPTVATNINTPLGIILVTVSAATFAMYEVLYGVLVQHEASISKNLLILGLIGVMSSLFSWPFFFLFHYTGWETFQLPLGIDMWSATITLALDLVLNIALCCGMYVTSPLFVSLGTLLSVPTSIIVDKITKDFLLPWQAMIGIGGIVAGFILINIADEIPFMKSTSLKWTFRRKEEPVLVQEFDENSREDSPTLHEGRPDINGPYDSD